MPLVPFEQAMQSRQAALTGLAQPTDAPADAPARKVSGLDLWSAAFRQNNIAANLPDLLRDRLALEDDPADEPDFDPLADEELAGFEEYADRFIGAHSRAETGRIKDRIRQEFADRQTLAQAGWGGLAASIAAGTLDPVTLASMALPGGQAATLGRGARIARMVGASVALDSAQEVALHAEQELRTAGESLVNIGAGALLTGALGRLATRVPRDEFEQMKALMKAHADGAAPHLAPVESTGGAARVGFGTTLEDETVAAGGETLLKTVGRISPLARLITSRSKRVRQIVQELADLPFKLKKHERGIASPLSAESEVVAERANLYRLVRATDEGWRAHRAGGGALNRGRFNQAVAAALRRGDVSGDDEVARVARLYRQYFDASREALEQVGLLPPGTRAQFAASYLPRVYDHAKIRADRTNLEKALRAYFQGAGAVADSEVDSAVDATIDTISGVLRGHAQVDPGFVLEAGPLKGRTLAVPDEVLEPWLVNDVDQIMSSYVRTIAPRLALARRFTEVDMRSQLADIRDEYAVLRGQAATDAEKDRLTRAMQADLRDLQAMRDRLLGKFSAPADPDSALVKTARVFRAANYLRLLGGQLLSSLPDAGRLVARHGLVRTGAKLARLVASPSLRRLSADEAHRFGTALEFVMDTRADTIADLGDELAGSHLDRVLRRETNRFSRITGMASWNAALKTMAAALEQDAIVRAARGGNLSRLQRANLAEIGVGDEMLERVGQQLRRHGTEEGGLFRAATDAWDDRQAARTFEAAIRKSADTVVLTKGIGDEPLFMSSEIGKTLMQFKGFGMASVNRLLVPMSQGLARGDLATVNGAMVMLALGALANAARDYAAGKEPATDPSRIAIEAFDRAGFTTYMAEPLDAVTGLIGGPRFGRFTSQSPFESLTGPTFGTAEDIYKTGQGIFTEKGDFDPSVQSKDVYRFRKLLPYQNLFYVRRLVNALEGEFSEAIGAEGAGSQSFTERVAETTPLKR